MVVRVLALVAAVAMVAGSIVLRNRLDRQEQQAGQAGQTGRSGQESRRDTDDGPLRLVCSTELREVCEALDRSSSGIDLQLTVEPAGTTATRLATGDAADLGLDGWLVTGPWPTIVDQRRAAASLDDLFADGPDTPLVRSPLALVMWADRAAALERTCAGPITWKCLGQAAPRQWGELGGSPTWGRVKPGQPDPVQEAVGLTVLGAQTASYFARTDIGSIDLREDPAYQSWLAGLARAVRATGSTGTSATSMLSGGRALADGVATTEAEALPVLARAADRSQVRVLYPAPVSTADVVLGVPSAGGRAGARLRDLLEGAEGDEAFTAAGWRGSDGLPPTTADAGPPLLASSGLPDPGLLDALRTAWQETR